MINVEIHEMAHKIQNPQKLQITPV